MARRQFGALGVGDRLRDLRGADAKPVWRPQYTRDSVALAVLHDDGCADCRAYRETLAETRSALRSWGGRVIVAMPAPDAEPRALPAIPDDAHAAPRIIIADRFGHVFAVLDGGPTHALPTPRELEDWIRFLGTQCPE